MTKTSVDSGFDTSFVSGWESFVQSVKTQKQHYHDFLNDMDRRRKVEQKVGQISDKQLKAKLIARIKIADETFIECTDLCPENIHQNTDMQYMPDSEWMYFRKPRIINASEWVS